MSLRPKVPPSPKSIAPTTPHQVKKQQNDSEKFNKSSNQSKDTKLDKFVIENAALKEEVKAKLNSFKRR